MTFEQCVMIERAVARAKAKHASLGPDPMAVLMEEVGEVARARLEGDTDAEAAELLDVIAVCVRRMEELGR